MTDAEGRPVAVTNGSFVMPASNVTVSAVLDDVLSPVLISRCLTLNGTICLTIKVKLPEGAAAADTFTVELYDEGRKLSEQPLSDYSFDQEGGVYLITYAYPARLMDNALTIRVFDTTAGVYRLRGSGGTDYADGYTTSVAACCDDYAADPDVKLRNLANAMKTYGVYAHSCLDEVPLPDPAPALTATADSFSAYKLKRTLPNGLKLKSMYLTLDTDTAINFRFTLEGETELENLTFLIGSGDEAIQLQPKQDGSSFLIRIPNILAQNLDKDITLRILESGNDTEYSVKCCAMYYGKLAMAAEGNAALKDAIRALWDYSQAANAYYA